MAVWRQGLEGEPPRLGDVWAVKVRDGKDQRCPPGLDGSKWMLGGEAQRESRCGAGDRWLVWDMRGQNKERAE